jgi:eukaryotic-like serine/threonine-protein kinase
MARLTVEDGNASTLAHAEHAPAAADHATPAQAPGSKKRVDARTDIYSLGCSLYYLLTGHPPVAKRTVPQLPEVQQKLPPASIYGDRPDAPSRLVDICTLMMAKKPEERYQTAADVAAALAQWIAAPEYQATSPSDSGLSLVQSPPAVADVAPPAAPAQPADAKGAAPPRRSSPQEEPPPRLPPVLAKRPAGRIPPKVSPPAARPPQQSAARPFPLSLEDAMASPPDRAHEPLGETQRHAHLASRKKTPVWIWIVVAVGTVLAIALAVVALKAS